MTWLALDIGGANLKAADGLGYARSVSFPLWRRPEQLPEALLELLASSPPCERLAVTMTGELADCYDSKADGVRAIAAAVQQVAGSRPVSIYLIDGRLVSVQAACATPLLAAASNWHALAAYACRYCRQAGGLLIDIGSTTCDIIPLDGSQPNARGRTDPERLANGELVYSGIERTPVCGLVRTLPWRGKDCPVALEWFAATVDAYLLLGDLPEEEENLDTADGRPRTRAAAHARMARTLCADTTLFSAADALSAAAVVREAQLDQLVLGLRQVVDRLPMPPAVVILSGHGEFLARRLFERVEWQAPVIALRQELGPEVARCGPAHALACLARAGAE
jgi:(4-(4-[2-(gamma-L-glutamylamino)ethyl]phenoxymethyl)furan-2-yl)methanamine synthase